MPTFTPDILEYTLFFFCGIIIPTLFVGPKSPSLSRFRKLFLPTFHLFPKLSALRERQKSKKLTQFKLFYKQKQCRAAKQKRLAKRAICSRCCLLPFCPKFFPFLAVVVIFLYTPVYYRTHRN